MARRTTTALLTTLAATATAATTGCGTTTTQSPYSGTVRCAPAVYAHPLPQAYLACAPDPRTEGPLSSTRATRSSPSPP